MKASLQSNQPLWEIRSARSSKVHTPVIAIKWVCHLNMVHHYASFRFQLFERFAKQSIMLKAPLLALHLATLKSHTEAITHVPQIVTYAVREKGMEYKRE